MLVVSSAADNTALTTLEEVKAQLSITATDEDTYLESAITRATAAVCTYLNVPTATDGTRTLGRETLVETLRLKTYEPFIVLGRYPISSIASITEDGTTVDASEYEIRGAGIVARLTDDDSTKCWLPVKIVVTYTAGWLLPDDDSRNLPQDIEDAAIALIKAARFNRTRDPLLRSENILESLYSYTLFSPSDKDGVMPADVAALLAPYRNVNI